MALGRGRTVVPGSRTRAVTVVLGCPRRPVTVVRDRDVTDVLVPCTANICRSPMAAALLARGLTARAAVASVNSAGLLADGEPPGPRRGSDRR